MATTYAKGFNTGIEIVPETSYGALAVSGQLRLPATSESMKEGDREWIKNTHMFDEGAAQRVGFQGRYKPVSGGIVTAADYDNCLALIKAALGTQATNNYSFAEENTESLSVVVDRKLKRFQFLGCMIEELRIRADTSDPRVFMEADFVGKNCNISDTALATSTLPTGRIKFSQLTFQIGDCSDALAGGDALTLSSFLLRIKNNFQVEYGNGSQYIIQPWRDKQREVTLEITATRYSSVDEIAAMETAAAAGSIMQSKLTFSDGASDSWIISIPEMYHQAQPHQNVAAKENSMKYTTTFDCYANINNSTYMADVAYELELDATT